MDFKIDWLSWTSPINGLSDEGGNESLNLALQAVDVHTNSVLSTILLNGTWGREPSHGFYSVRYVEQVYGISLSWGEVNKHVFVEISGTSCERVFATVEYKALLQEIGGRCSRVDIACDIATDIPPSVFCLARGSSNFKASGLYTSESGETAYIGSRKGGRMARVYRYSTPHPRSHLLRVEIELKKDSARQICKALCLAPLTEVGLSVNLPFSWEHPVWQPGSVTVGKIPARPYDRHGAGTLRWLELTVVPAVRKAAKEGLIDLEKWLSEHFDVDIAP